MKKTLKEILFAIGAAIVGALGALVAVFSFKTSKQVQQNNQDIGSSKAQDTQRTDVVAKAKEQVVANQEAINEANKILGNLNSGNK